MAEPDGWEDCPIDRVWAVEDGLSGLVDMLRATDDLSMVGKNGMAAMLEALREKLRFARQDLLRGD